MKKLLQFPLLIVALFLTSIPISAHDFEVDGIYYNITNSTDKTVAVTFNGRYGSSVVEYSGDVVIPCTVEYNNVIYTISSIGDYAFEGCYGLTSVTIPNSVTTIGNYAFSYCTGLSKIIVDSENTVFDSRDNCNAIISTFTNTLIVGCKNTSIPNSVKRINDYAFNGCTGLTSITIPESATSIGNGAFFDCSGLTSITIPESVFYIGSNAFNNCSGLTSITIPESVTYIGSNAFYGCNGLTEVNITDLSAWCKINFDLANANPLYYVGHLKLNSTEITNLVIPDDISEIKAYAFYGCNGLTSVTIPNSVTSIGYNAFGECVNLASVELPNPWPTIGDYAFGRTGLTFVNVPNSQTNIDPNVFRDCRNLCINIEKGNDPILIKKSRTFRCNKVYIGRPISYVGTSSYTNLFDSISELAIDYEIKVLSDEMFKYAKNLKVLSIGNGESVLKIGYLENSGYYDSRGKGLFYNLPLDSVYIGRPISYDAAKCYGYSPFADVKTLRHLTLDCNNINTTLMPYFFENCNSLETVIIQNSHSQMSLPAEFFKGCVNLKSLTLPFPGTGTAQTTSNFGELFGTESNSNMRAVTQYFEDGTNKTYYLPTGLEELVLTEGCEMIPYGGLYNCNMLKKLTLPTSLYMVGDKALYGCAQIADIYCKGADPAVAYDSSFDGMRLTSCKLHVPFNSSERYKISDGWKRFYYVEEEAPLVVSVAKNIENAGVVYGINEYQPGQVAEVEAVAHSGYTFVGWYENGNLLTTDSKYTIMVTDCHSLVAMFAPVLDENDVEVSPKAENVTLSWAQETGAAYYNIDIYSNAAMTMPVGSMVVDNSGQPVSRSVTAVSATIDGLSELQNYYYSITAYGAEETILSKYTGSFSTIAGVEEVMGNTNAVEIARYDIHGRLLSAPIKGINIVKMSNGSTRKEFVK